MREGRKSCSEIIVILQLVFLNFDQLLRVRFHLSFDLILNIDQLFLYLDLVLIHDQGFSTIFALDYLGCYLYLTQG